MLVCVHLVHAGASIGVGGDFARRRSVYDSAVADRAAGAAAVGDSRGGVAHPQSARLGLGGLHRHVFEAVPDRTRE